MPRSFSTLLLRMPPILVESYDALYHKTESDLIALAQHELDLHEEGEVTLATDDLNAVRNYINYLMEVE